jgi:hypothetical protein
MFGDGVLMLGKGDGTFHMGWLTKTYYPPFGIVYGDFNGDGKLDLAYIGFDPNNPNNPPREVRVMLGDGTGKFHLGSAFWDTTGLGFRWLAAGDFNGDGKLDLAVIRGPKLDMFLGNGDGTFRHSMERPFPGTGNGQMIVAGDFNGDGKLDLVAMDQNEDIYLLFGKQDGSFRYPAMPITVGGGGAAQCRCRVSSLTISIMMASSILPDATVPRTESAYFLATAMGPFSSRPSPL